MKLLSDTYRLAAALLGSACLLVSCRGDAVWGDRVEVEMRIGVDHVIGVRAFSNDDPPSVDRILVIPFIKDNAAEEDNANYTAPPNWWYRSMSTGFR